MPVRLKFCGAAGVVTGSCYLVKTARTSFLVDCGLYQGSKTVRALNYQDFAFDPAEIDFVLLTHAHIDHSGLLPRLYSRGFSGPSFATEATRDLLGFMLPDAGYIQESEVRFLNRRNRARGLAEVEPIYTREDAEACLEHIKATGVNGWTELAPGVRARFWNAGHILGSVSIELLVQDEEDDAPVHMLFSGDIGPEHKAFHPDPESPQGIDILLVESTYGDRPRGVMTVQLRREALKSEILEAVKAGGNIVIPAFAVERTQELLLDLDVLMRSGKIPAWPLFIDSPLATRVTGIFEKYRSVLEDIEGLGPFQGKNVRYIETVEESKALANIRSGAIIMSASGMCEAGRIRHHLKNTLWDSASTILFVGYQAPGSLGHILENGAKRVRIHGDEIDVRARIHKVEGYSAHADQTELLAWVQDRLPVHQGIFIVHGEEGARTAFRHKLTESGLADNLIFQPQLDDLYELRPRKKPAKVLEAPRLKSELLTTTDWHNEYAAYLVDLAEGIRRLPDDDQRRALLAEARALLGRYSRTASTVAAAGNGNKNGNGTRGTAGNAA